MSGNLQSIWRYPIKGFTPEPLEGVTLAAGEHVPFDRLFAVENGPSGFDPATPRHISKQKFTVLARFPAVARIRTAFDDATGFLQAEAPGAPPFEGDLNQPDAAAAFAGWLAVVLGEDARGPLRVLHAPRAHRFMDDEEGFVSIINLASVRALEAAVGRPVDPLRLRANLYVDGWPAWAEDATPGGSIQVGTVRMKIAKTITRCVATHVDPATGERDMELVRNLFESFGHTHCGIYASVTEGGRLSCGDVARLDAPA